MGLGFFGEEAHALVPCKVLGNNVALGEDVIVSLLSLLASLFVL